MSWEIHQRRTKEIMITGAPAMRMSYSQVIHTPMNVSIRKRSNLQRKILICRIVIWVTMEALAAQYQCISNYNFVFFLLLINFYSIPLKIPLSSNINFYHYIWLNEYRSVWTLDTFSLYSLFISKFKFKYMHYILRAYILIFSCLTLISWVFKRWCLYKPVFWQII